MNYSDYFNNVLKSFERYFTITSENCEKPYFAQAEFSSHGEQYFLVKSAKLSEIDTREFVYFYGTEKITYEELQNLSEQTWNLGCSRINSYYGHKNSDISLIIAVQTVDDNIKKQIKKIKFSKSYKFGIYGYSNFKLAIKELSTNQVFSNRLGTDYKKLLLKIN